MIYNDESMDGYRTAAREARRGPLAVATARTVAVVFAHRDGLLEHATVLVRRGSPLEHAIVQSQIDSGCRNLSAAAAALVH